MEQTLSIIKPDAVKNGFVDDINYLISENGLNILKSKKVKISREIAEKFYSEKIPPLEKKVTKCKKKASFF